MNIFKNYQKLKKDFERSDKDHSLKMKKMSDEFDKQKKKNDKFQKDIEDKIKSIQNI